MTKVGGLYRILLVITALGALLGGNVCADGSLPVKVSAADPNSQYMAVGAGNTLQIYDLQKHQLVSTLSLPAVETDNTAIGALAVNPVSFIVAVGGRSQGHSGKRPPLYLYGTDGRLYARIKDLPGDVRALAFSRDGRLLAVATAGERSLQVFQMKPLTVTYAYTIHPDLSAQEKEALKRFSEIEDITMEPERIFRDSKISGDIAAVAYLNDDRLISASADGVVRLYDRNLHEIKNVQIDKGGCPATISLSPDGSRLAMTFSDSERVDVLSAADLSYLYSPNIARFAGGKIESVSWSSDSQSLYALGHQKASGSAAVGRWADAGKGHYSAIKDVPATVTEMTAMKGGGVAYLEVDRNVSVLDRRYATYRNERLTMWTAVGAKFGDVTYQIGGHYVDIQGGTEGESHFPISELKWPINAMMGEVGAEWRVFQHWEFRASAYHNLTNSFDGQMEDSDWIYNTDITDIYSESSVDFQGYGVDLGLRYWFIDRHYREDKSLGIGVGIGFIYQKYNWDACNAVQTYPASGGTPDILGGMVGQYEGWLSMPYLELAVKSKLGRFEWSGSFGGSPYVMTSNRDNHLLRDRISWGEAHGWAFKATLDGVYTFAGDWFAGARLNFLYYTTDGTLLEIDSGDPAYSIDMKITSLQYDLMFKFGRRF